MTLDPSLGRQALALAIGAASGFGASLLGLPLPWLLGAMIGSTAAAVSGVPMTGPNRLRPIVIPVIGVMLGSSVTSEVIAQFLGFWPALALLLPFLGVTALVSYGVYRWIGRFDRVTAYFCGMPGGLNDMMILGAAAGGNERQIALAHATRVLAVITFVVLFYGFALDVQAVDSGSARFVALSAPDPADWAILAACAAIGAPLGVKIGLPAPQIFGPMLLSGAAHATGLVVIAPPTILVVIAQVVVGTVVGCRFIGVAVRDVGREVALGVLSSGAMIASALGFALLLSRLSGDPLSLSFLALSPGGLTEMSLLALAMGSDVVYVTTIHILRIVIVIALAAPVLKALRRT